MSLLKKASIITTPTAYAEDFLYNIKPAGGLGDELVTNGTFDTDSNWNKSATFSISNGKLHCLSDGSHQYAIQANVFVVGRTYKLTFEIVDYTSGEIRVRPSGQIPFQRASAKGVYTFYYTATNTTLIIERQSACDLYVDNVSVKEVVDFDFTRNSTGTRVNEDYLIETVATNTPRIDYTNGEPSILLEPSRTNTVKYSQDFSQYSSGSGFTLTTGFLAPDGTNSATKITATIGTSSLSRIGESSTTASRTIWARTVSGTGQAVLLSHYSNTNNAFTITEKWQRFEVNSAVAVGGGNFYAIDFRNGFANSLSEIIVWGAQSEEATYATSLIHTSGSAVTRSADVANNAGNSDLINSTEGVLYAEIKALADDGTFRVIAINGAGTSANENRIQIYFRDTANIINFGMESGNSAQFFNQFSLDVKLNNKLALKYSASSCSFWINGIKVGEELNKVMPTNLSRLDFNLQTNNDNFFGNCKMVAVFKEALTDLELACLTGYNNHELYMNYYNRLSYLGLVEEYNVESDINNYIL